MGVTARFTQMVTDVSGLDHLEKADAGFVDIMCREAFDIRRAEGNHVDLADQSGEKITDIRFAFHALNIASGAVEERLKPPNFFSSLSIEFSRGHASPRLPLRYTSFCGPDGTRTVTRGTAGRAIANSPVLRSSRRIPSVPRLYPTAIGLSTRGSDQCLLAVANHNRVAIFPARRRARPDYGAGRHDRSRVAAVRVFPFGSLPDALVFQSVLCRRSHFGFIDFVEGLANRAADQRADQRPAGESHFVTAPLAEFGAYYRAGSAPNGGPEHLIGAGLTASQPKAKGRDKH